jgi:hypothetical protein
MRVTLGAIAVSTLILIGFGGPPLSVLLGSAVFGSFLWWRSASAR